jgi:LL-diaminopimelate aminotransferase
MIDMGVGEPDEMAFPEIIKKLAEEAAKPENRGYTDNGIQEFKDAAVSYMKTVFGVDGINPLTEVVHAIGSKPALAMLPSVLVNPGDAVIMTVPGYPVLGTHSKWYGAEVYTTPLLEKNGFLPDLKTIPEEICEKAKLMYVNYPNNPTGAMATEAFYKELISFAKKRKIAIVQDAAYSTLVYDQKPLSILSLPGGKDVAIEIHSLSKAFNMTGWRLAFVVGNELLVKGFAEVKDNNDSGQFAAIQKAGVYCLQHPEITDKIVAKYNRKMNGLVEVLCSVGFRCKKSGGTFYLYVKAPKRIKGGPEFKNAEEFSQFLIREKLISTVPWDDAGSFVRFSVTFVAKGDAEEKRVLSEIKKRLSDIELEF